MATARAKKRTPFKGRTWVAIGLFVFVAFTSLVVWRRSVGVSTANAIAKQDAQRRALLAQIATLQRDISDAQTRRHIVAEAERRLGLHVAPEAQSRVLAEPAREP